MKSPKNSWKNFQLLKPSPNQHKDCFVHPKDLQLGVCVWTDRLRDRDKSPFIVLIPLQVPGAVYTFILFNCSSTQNAQIPSPTKVYPSRSQPVLLFSFCLWPGTLCCGTAELSRFLSSFQNSLAVMALIWEGGEMCLHPLSSDKTSGRILHPLIPGLLCRQWTGPPTNAWIQSALSK